MTDFILKKLQRKDKCINYGIDKICRLVTTNMWLINKYYILSFSKIQKYVAVWKVP